MLCDWPETPAVMSQSACASSSVSRTAAYVAPGDSGCFGLADPGGGSAGTGITSGCTTGQTVGTLAPVIHWRTALTAQPDGSAVTVLWPTPGTSRRCPCGNWATIDC